MRTFFTRRHQVRQPIRCEETGRHIQHYGAVIQFHHQGTRRAEVWPTPCCPGMFVLLWCCRDSVWPQQRMQDPEYGRDGDGGEQASRSQVYVAKDIYEGEVSFKDHDEGKAGDEGTSEKKEPRVTSSNVHMSDPSNSSSNMAMRRTARRHDDDQGREEVTRSTTSSDDSNLMRGTVMTRNDEEIGEEATKPKFKCLNFCNVDNRDISGRSGRNGKVSST